MRLKEILMERELYQHTFAEMLGGTEQGWNANDLNKIINYRLLPTPKALSRICEVLDVLPLDIYERKEIDLLGVCQPDTPTDEAYKRKETRTNKKLCVRLSPWAAEKITPEVIKACGYRTISEWIHECTRKLYEQYLTMHGGKDEKTVSL